MTRAIYLSILTVLLWLSAVGQPPRLMLPIRHTSDIETAVFSVDSKLILTRLTNGTAAIWDAKTGLLLSSLEINEKLSKVKFTPDGKWIIGRTGSKIIFWDTKDCSLKKTIVTDTIKVVTGREVIEPLPGNENLLVSTYDNTRLEVINIATGKHVLTSPLLSWFWFAILTDKRDKVMLQGLDSSFIWDMRSNAIIFSELSNKGTAAQFNKDVSLISISLKNDTLITLKLPEKKINFKTSIYAKGFTYPCYHYDPSGKLIAVLVGDSTIKIFNAMTGACVQTLEKTNLKPEKFLFNKEGTQLLTTECEGDPAVWDLASGKIITRLYGNGEREYGWKDFKAVSFSSQEDKIIGINLPGNVFIWDAKTGALLNRIELQRSYYSADIELSPDGKSALVYSDHYITNIDIVNQKTITDLKGNVVKVNAVQVDRIHDRIFTSNTAGFIFWDGKFVKPPEDVRGFLQPVTKAAIFGDIDVVPSIMELKLLKDKHKLIFPAADGTVYFMDYVNNKADAILLGNIKHAFHWLSSAHVSDDGKKMATFINDTLDIWDLEKAKKFDRIINKQFDFLINSASFSTDGTRCVVSSDSAIFIYDFHDGHYRLSGSKALDASAYGIRTVNARYAFAENNLQTLVWDIDSSKEHCILENSAGVSFLNTAPRFSSDGKNVFAIRQGELLMWDFKSGKLLNKFTNSDIYQDFSIIDSSLIMIMSTKGVCHAWDYRKKLPLYDFASFGQDNYFVSLPSGEFKASPGAARLLHYVMNDLKTITFEQLDARYNRPDKVLIGVGSKDSLLIRSFRRAYEKRIKRLGIDTASFRDGLIAPEADIVNRGDTAINGFIKLHVRAFDKKYTLNRFNVWVNEVPLYGQSGIDLNKRKLRRLDTTIVVRLSDGVNNIETSVFNSAGTESFRSPFQINYTPTVASSATTYFIGIGVDSFADSTQNLKYSVKDIRDLTAKLAAKYSGNIHVDTFFNKQVTVQQIKSLKQTLMKSGINDRVIIAYSGHGLLSDSLDYYLSTYAVNFIKPEKQGLPYEELENLLDGIPARKKLLLIDACHSGEFDKTDFSITSGNTDTVLEEKNSKGKTRPRRIGLENSFELMQSLFVNVGKGTGSTIISAASGVELASEDDKLKNGVFISALLHAIDKFPSISLSNLKKEVVDEVTAKTQGKQKPSLRNDPINVDWTVW